MISPDRVLDITTLSQTTALPRVIRLAREQRAADYRLQPATWSWEQATLQITLGGCGAAWPHGDDVMRSIPRGRALLYHNRSQPDLVYGLPDRGASWDFLYVNLLGTAAVAMVAELAHRHDSVIQIDAADPLWSEIGDLLPPPGRPVHRVWSLAQATTLAQRVLLAVSAGLPSARPHQDDDDHLVRHAMAHIADRLAERWTIARLARDVGVSREHLTRAFVAATGLPAAAWLRRERVAAARRLLRGGSSIAAVARSCGFKDAAHFAAIFRGHTGQLPSSYRRRGGG